MRKLVKRWQQSIGCVKKFRLDSNVDVKEPVAKKYPQTFYFLLCKNILLIVAQFPEVEKQDCPF